MSQTAEFHIDEFPTADSPPIRKVLVPTDGSDAILRVFEIIAPIFGCCRATIHALHVRECGAVTRDRIRYDPDEAAAETLKVFNENLSSQGFDTRSHLAQGVPAEEIVKIARAMDVDMVVMVTRRSNAILNRSITQSVISSVGVPVLVLHA